VCLEAHEAEETHGCVWRLMRLKRPVNVEGRLHVGHTWLKGEKMNHTVGMQDKYEPCRKNNCARKGTGDTNLVHQSHVGWHGLSVPPVTAHWGRSDLAFGSSSMPIHCPFGSRTRP